MAYSGLITVAAVFLCLALDSAHGRGYVKEPCCTSYTRNPVPVRRLTDYRNQTMREHCNSDAIIFRTVVNKEICATIEDKWVQRAVSFLRHQKAAKAHSAAEQKLKKNKNHPASASSGRKAVSTTESSQTSHSPSTTSG